MRPFFTLSSTSSGRLSGPLITVWPDTLLAPMMRNQRPQLGTGLVSVFSPGRSRVTGCAMPCGVTSGLKPWVTISPVGCAGSTDASGVCEMLIACANSGPDATSSAPPFST